jgi:Anaphase-promoting complex APC subunit CDC26
MLRRQPTAISLTPEDVVKFEEDRQRRLAQKNMENVFDNSKGSNAAEKHSSEKPRPKTTADRIMGTGNAN